MQAAVQTGGSSTRPLSGVPSSQQLKSGSEALNASAVCPSLSKGKKRERVDQNLDPSKRERSVKLDDNDSGVSKHERNMKAEDIASIIDKDGGFFNFMGVDRLVQLMQQERVESSRKCTDTASRRSMLAGVIAASERDDCLNRFVQQGGLTLLDDWLQEAQRGVSGDTLSPKEGGKVSEELLLVLLQALDRLPVNLEALKTCIVGKSVNHLRTHKNPEIQKRARKLVDVWKKRVDAEMKSVGEVKTGSNHGISWSCKQPSPDSMHTHLVKNITPSEAVVKSPGSFTGSMKGGVNCCTISEPKINVSIAGTKCSGLASPSRAPAKDGSSKLSTNCLNDLQAAVSKEEKTSISGLNQNNGQGWGNVPGKGASMKEEGRNCISASSNPSVLTPGPRLQMVSSKGPLSSGLVGTQQKEVVAGKPLVWSRSVSDKTTNSVSSAEKSAVDIYRGECSSPQGRLVVRIPNPGKAGLSGAAAVEAPQTETLIRCPAATADRQNVMVCQGPGDVPDGKGRVSNTSARAGSTERCDETRAGLLGDSSDKPFCAKTNECEKVVEGSAPHVKLEGPLTGAIAVVNETECDYGENSPKHILKSVDSFSRCQKPHTGDTQHDVNVDASGMSLLATIAASEISSGVSLHGAAEASSENEVLACSRMGPLLGNDADKYCSRTDKEREMSCGGSSPFQTLRPDGTVVCGIDVGTAKCSEGKVEANELEINPRSSTDDPVESNSRQHTVIASVGEESSLSFDAKDSLLSEGDPTNAVGSFTRSPDLHGDKRLAVVGEQSRRSVSTDPCANEDKVVCTGHLMVGHHDQLSASGKAGRWETVLEEKNQSVVFTKNGK